MLRFTLTWGHLDLISRSLGHRGCCHFSFLAILPRILLGVLCVTHCFNVAASPTMRTGFELPTTSCGAQSRLLLLQPCSAHYIHPSSQPHRKHFSRYTCPDAERTPSSRLENAQKDHSLAPASTSGLLLSDQ